MLLPQYKVVIKTPCMRPLHFFSGTSMIRHHCGVPNIYPLLTGRLKGNRLSLAISHAGTTSPSRTNSPHCLWLHSRLICVLSMKHVHSFGARVQCHPKSQCRSENERLNICCRNNDQLELVSVLGQQSHIIARRQWSSKPPKGCDPAFLQLRPLRLCNLSWTYGRNSSIQFYLSCLNGLYTPFGGNWGCAKSGDRPGAEQCSNLPKKTSKIASNAYANTS